MKMAESAARYADFSSLTFEELLALSLRESNADQSDLRALVKAFPSTRDLFEASIEELRSIPGIGSAKALAIRAIIEVARRYATLPPEPRTRISSPSDVARLMRPRLQNLNHEVFACLLLDSKHSVLEILTVSVGTLNSSLVHPRELFRTAIKRACAAVVLVHNHPSSDPTPSAEDVSLTRRLVEAGKLLGIEVLDHVVVASGGYFSFRERGQI